MTNLIISTYDLAIASSSTSDLTMASFGTLYNIEIALKDSEHCLQQHCHMTLWYIQMYITNNNLTTIEAKFSDWG